MTLADVENKAGLCRITCGWKKPELPIDWVRRYWRDVHSPAIARRAGIYDYRHYQYETITPNFLTPVDDISYDAPPLEQLMWTSDVRYSDEETLAIFDKSPEGKPKADILGDIEIIVDQSTTYRAVNENAFTYIDDTGVAMPQGSYPSPSYALFIRSRGNEDAFRACLRQISKIWSVKTGVLRLRLSLFDTPDMEKERKAGYPVKTHPVEHQYQAWIDLTVDTHTRGKSLVDEADGIDYATNISAIHAYPIHAIYTSNYNGKPTLVGLRGYPSYQALTALNAENQRQTSLLTWMYGEIAKDGTAEGS